MTEQLKELLHVEATRLEVPTLHTDEILHRGRSLRRRRRAVAGVAVLAARVVGGAGVASVVSRAPGTQDTVPFSPSGFDDLGALAVDSQLYVAGEHVPLRGAVKSFLSTADGVVVRSGTSPWTDDPDVDHYTLVSSDGGRTQVDLTTNDRVVATEPDSRHLAYAAANGDRWDVVVMDLQTGNELSRTTVDGTFTWGGWEAPPVALDGDRVWAHFDGGWTEVDWRTGSTREVPGTQRVYEVANGHYAVQGADGTWTIRSVETGEQLARVRLPKGWYGTFSPDGSKMKFYDQDDGMPGAERTLPFVYDVATGERTTIDGYAWDYGWTPGGDLLTIDDGDVKTCALPGGQCVPTGLSVEVGQDSTVKLGGNSYES
jgi:hypothetical protein